VEFADYQLKDYTPGVKAATMVDIYGDIKSIFEPMSYVPLDVVINVQ